MTGLMRALVIVLVLLTGFWLLFRDNPSERLPALRATLLFTSLLFVMGFAALVLHEGGHALYLLVKGVPVTLYVHPFAFAGYSRPIIDSSIWKDILGAAVAIPVAMVISLPFWKQRSLALLPLVIICPYVLFGNGMYIFSREGDFQNLMQTTGLPPIVLIIVGALIALAGILLLFSLFPLLGLTPRDKRALFAIPAALFLWGSLSMIVACLVVPGSPIDQKYFLASEILPPTSSFHVNTILGAVLAVLYLTLYRWLYPKLPAGLRTEVVSPNWKDLRFPAVLAVICVMLGLIIIT